MRLNNIGKVLNDIKVQSCKLKTRPNLFLGPMIKIRDFLYWDITIVCIPCRKYISCGNVSLAENNSCNHLPSVYSDLFTSKSDIKVLFCDQVLSILNNKKVAKKHNLFFPFSLLTSKIWLVYRHLKDSKYEFMLIPSLKTIQTWIMKDFNESF